MDEILRVKQPIDDCPFCRSPGKLIRRRLWYGENGYVGKYSYRIACDNPSCKVQPSTIHRTDIYEHTDDTINKIISYWNWDFRELFDSFDDDLK